MTEHNSPTYTSQATGLTSKETFVDATDFGNKVRWVEVGLASDHGLTLAQNDTINLCKIRKDECIKFVGLKVGDLGTSVTLAVAFNDGSARTVLSATDVATAAVNTVLISEYRTAAAIESDVVATLAGGNPADDQEIKVILGIVNIN